MNNAPAHQPLPRKFYGMTIGIGLICKDGVVLASDSRTEDDGSHDGESSIKRFDLEKISTFTCGDMKCAIARSGMTVLSGNALRLINEVVDTNPPTTVGDLLEVMRKAVAQTRREFVCSNPMMDYADPTGRFSLILAVFCRGVSQLYVFHAHTNWYTTEKSTAYIGSGRLLADHLLSGVNWLEHRADKAIYAAVYATEIAKLKDSGCEGRTLLVFISENNHFLAKQDEVDRISAECLKFKTQNEVQWITSLRDWITAPFAGGK